MNVSDRTWNFPLPSLFSSLAARRALHVRWDWWLAYASSFILCMLTPFCLFVRCHFVFVLYSVFVFSICLPTRWMSGPALNSSSSIIWLARSSSPHCLSLNCEDLFIDFSFYFVFIWWRSSFDNLFKLARFYAVSDVNHTQNNVFLIHFLNLSFIFQTVIQSFFRCFKHFPMF